MVVTLNPEQEQVIAKAIEARIISKPEDVIEMVVAVLRQQLALSPPRSTRLSDEEWSNALNAWLDSHPVDAPILSDEIVSRESNLP